MKVLPILCSLALSALAQTPPTETPVVVVTGNADDLLSVAPTSSEGRVSAADIASRPLLRRSEILEAVPGMITTQHAGGGKATQYFLRGFNLDHGTDFATSIDFMPMNLRTHAHGQGYTDLNPLIPELVERVDYTKGTSSAMNGDLSTAGSANFKLYDRLPQDLASIEIGQYGYYRGLIAGTLDLTTERALTYGFEFNRYDGPFQLSEDFARWNGLVRYFDGDEDNHFSATLMGYDATWTSSDQIPQRAVLSGALDRFGNLDPTNGGDSRRYSLNLEWATREGDVVTKANVFGVYYDLNLFSNFTYLLDYPDRGDQFQQAEQRWIWGANVARTWEHRQFLGHDADFTLGFQTRHDVINGIGLWRTLQRQRFQNIRLDEVYEGNAGVFADSTVRWNDWFRTQVGLRADVFYFDTLSDTAANTGNDLAGIVSPKFSAIFGPWNDTELYLNFGTGFHSNDARGVTTVIDPSTGERVPAVDPLVRTLGAEIGLRTQAIDSLTSTLTLFWLHSDSELVYVGDAGTNEAGPASRRYGIEWTNAYRPNDWFSADAEIALTHGRFENGDHIPNSVPLMFSGGVTFGAQSGDTGFFASLRARAFANRPLTEDGRIQARDSLLINASLGYRTPRWEAAVDGLNLLDRADNDIEYFYTSRLAGEGAKGVSGRHFHPVEPRMVRFRFTYKF